MSVTSAWLIAAVENMPIRYVTINATPYAIAAGNYYLFDGNPNLSLLQQLQDAMDTEGITGASVILTGAGYVKISASVAFSMTWTDTTLRNHYGFSGNIPSTTSATATNRSDLWWSPGSPERPEKSPYGTAGADIGDVVHTSSRTGLTSQTETRGASRTVQRLVWEMVDIDRVKTSSAAAGEFAKFYEERHRAGYTWKLYHGVNEDDSSTSAFNYVSALGPYKRTERVRDDWYNRLVNNADLHTRIEIDCQVASELT